MSESENLINTNKKPRKKNVFKKYLGLILVLLVVVLALTSVYFYKKSVGVTDKVSQEEVKSLVQKVSRLVVVPTDETPTIATVSDPEALKNQAFFIDAKKGDKVLIYSNAKKAVLYDPVADKIVNIAPLNSETQTPTTTPVTPKS
ncbi:MAG: hypothetical protein KBC11_03270 [Candidatus Pacebacteria bacterium]|nr:hypothetical protein [Candidatus Paceibacterota bacterium]